MNWFSKLLVLGGIAAAVAAGETSVVQAEAVTGRTIVEAGPKRVSLLEVFSSEGCSSCPPAEKWISRLASESGLWSDFVPAVFHVDYWDHLGWKDIFASKRFTDRQQGYAWLWGSSSIYTPGFVLDGQEWTRWRAGGAEILAGKGRPGRLKIEALSEQTYRVTFRPESVPGIKPAKTLKIYLVLLGSGIVSDVKRGENAGRVLTHDYTVLTFSQAEVPLSDEVYSAVLPLKRPSKVVVPRRSIAAWVEDSARMTPLQAAGADL